MIQRVLLVAWKTSAATQWVSAIESRGYVVFLEDTTGDRAWRIAKERGIHLVIIDGQKKPSHGISTGDQLRDTKKTADLPIIWSNLNPENDALVRAKVWPEVVLPAVTEVESVLAAMKQLQPEKAHPADLGVAAPPNVPAPKPPSPSAIIPTPPKAMPKREPAPPVEAKPAAPPAPAKPAARPDTKKPAKAAAKKPVAKKPAPRAKAAAKPAKATARRS